jgi:hypothetical protein
MSTQPEALRLAETVEFGDAYEWSASEVAAELRRLHAENEALRQAIEQADQSQDWSLLEATQESLREHMAEIQRLRASLVVAAADRQRIAEWVEDMCAGLDAKTIANGIRNGGNDAIEAFIKETT